MALFQDKRKPVDIYAKGSPTEKAQQVTSNIATAPIRASGNVAFAPAKALMENVVAPAAQAAVQPLVDANKRNQRFMGQQKAKVVGNAANREADALLYGSGEKQVGGTGTFSPRGARQGLGVKPAQSFTPQAMQRDGIQSQRMDPATASSFRRAVAPPVSPYTEAANEAMKPTQTVYTNSGDNITTEQQPMRLGNPAASQSSGNRRVSMNQQAGNLDIQFDPGTDEQSIRRFMENPVRPTAAINRFNASRGMDAGQGQRAAMNADRILGTGATLNREPELFTKENSPGMGWQTRLKLNEQLLANRQSEKNTQTDAATRIRTAQMSEATGAEQNDINRLRAKTEAQVSQGQLGVSRMKAESDASVNSAAVAGSRFDTGRKQYIDSIQKKYATAPEGPEREALGRQLTGMGEAVDPSKAYELEGRKIAAQERKTATESAKLTAQTLNGLDPEERNRTLISRRDPNGEQDEVQKMAKAAVRETALKISDAFTKKSSGVKGFLSSGQDAAVFEEFFPPDMDIDVAAEIVDNIPNEKLRLSIGRLLGKREKANNL